MTSSNSPIVIVDGYSTGRELVRELGRRDIDCFHLRSSVDVPEPAAPGFDASPYRLDLGYLGDARAAAAALVRLSPRAVVAGSEWGVLFAEKVAALLVLPTNRETLASARRDKFEMIEAVRRAGLRAARQATVSSVASARDWAACHGDWPVVVKPLASAGADGLFICNTVGDIDHAFATALHKRNFMGLRNDSLLIQSYLSGPQFIVNTVSRGGRHYVSDAWHMTFKTLSGSAIVAEEIHLLDPAEPRSRVLFEYATAAITALGIENGAAHTELKWTPEGPALVETGARLMGAAMDEPSYGAAGLPTQARVYAQALSSPGCFDRALERGHYGLRRHLTKVFFLFEQDGEIAGVDGLRRLAGLPSFDAHYRPLSPGTRVCKTVDMQPSGGTVYLVHDDRDRIAADVAQMRRWERQGLLYTVRASAGAAA